MPYICVKRSFADSNVVGLFSEGLMALADLVLLDEALVECKLQGIVV